MTKQQVTTNAHENLGSYTCNLGCARSATIAPFPLTVIHVVDHVQALYISLLLQYFNMFRSMDSLAGGSEPSTSLAAVLIAGFCAHRSSQNCCDLLTFQVSKSLRSFLAQS